ncbi:MAG TPA: transglutaminase-like domain-containing protein [Chthoniobacterales bacterium]
MQIRSLTVLLGVIVTLATAAAEEKPAPIQDAHLCALARTDFKAFARQLGEGTSSEVGRTRAIVRFLTRNFEWKTTDYQKRTVPEIIERRGGNCNDFSIVALAAMEELNIRARKVHEIHIRTNSPERGARADALVKEKGDSYSVFGRHHNDHVWLEIYDSSASEWIPADPWSGLVGTEDWMKGRVWFGPRSSLNPDAVDMIVPIAIFAADANGKFTIDRTKHYLVDEFDRLYDGRLHEQPAWQQWVAMLDILSQKVEGAFAGKINLHEYESQIDTLAATYDQLRAGLQNSPGKPHHS